MKWIQIYLDTYLVGYAIVLGGVIAALWQAGAIERVGPTWTAIGIVIAVGLGFMASVANGGNEETVEIDERH